MLFESEYFDAPAIHELSLESFLLAVSAKISFMSLHVRLLLAARTRAATPATCGADALVPPKVSSYPLDPSVDKMPGPPVVCVDGAHNHRLGPISE